MADRPPGIQPPKPSHPEARGRSPDWPASRSRSRSPGRQPSGASGSGPSNGGGGGGGGGGSPGRRRGRARSGSRGPRSPPRGGSPPPQENKIFVVGLASDWDNEELARMFSEFGKVEEAKVIYNHDTKQSRGFGFVQFAAGDVRAANDAIREFNDTTQNGRKCLPSFPARLRRSQRQQTRGSTVERGTAAV